VRDGYQDGDGLRDVLVLDVQPLSSGGSPEPDLVPVRDGVELG
jgi:hypothetical protein